MVAAVAGFVGVQSVRGFLSSSSTFPPFQNFYPRII